jgi:hypothetical protein
MLFRTLLHALFYFSVFIMCLLINIQLLTYIIIGTSGLWPVVPIAVLIFVGSIFLDRLFTTLTEI